MNIIKATRINLKITQDELSSLLGLSRRQIVNLENGTHQVKKNIGMFCLMLKHFNIGQIQKLELDLMNYEIKGDIF